MSSKQLISDEGIDESIRIAVYLTLKKFCARTEEKEYSFPSSFSKDEKNYVRSLVLGMGLKCKNEVKDMSRVLTIFKESESCIMEEDATLKISLESQKLLKEAMNRFPITEKERQAMPPFSEREKNPPYEAQYASRTVSKLKSSIPLIPPMPVAPNDDLKAFRESLPIFKHKAEILFSSSNRENNVTLLCGSSGSGKTTQVPQYILESASSTQSRVRILCSVPTRLSVLSASERVAFERGEYLGSTVGYQIRLESITSPRTTLHFCTHEIFLRSLMGEVEPFLYSLSHIIIDQVQERSVHSDFLLTVLREYLSKLPHLKLILISDSPNIDFLKKYFPGSHHIHILSHPTKINEFYLEDVLRELKMSSTQNIDHCVADEKSCQSPGLMAEADEALFLAFTHCSREKFEAAYNLVQDSNLSINYQHSSTGINLLMIGAAHGFLDFLENLVLLGAKLSLRTNKNNYWTALDFANNLDQIEASSFLTSVYKEDEDDAQVDLVADNEKTLYDISLISGRNTVDLNLIHKLIHHISNTDDSSDAEGSTGSIIVFLPGYDEISRLWTLLSAKKEYSVFCLHSRIPECRNSLFDPPDPGKWKIILSTSVGESSVNIPNIDIVIDSGQKEGRNFNYPNRLLLSEPPLWISKCSALRRREKAQRKIYCTYTRARFEYFQEELIPEIQRSSSSSLVELCLQVKFLVPPNTSIVEFLSKAPSPPPIASTRLAVRACRILEALSPSGEKVTELGSHLLDFPLKPHLGKMLLYGVTLKCLDPILTIVCCLSFPEPFSHQARVSKTRQRFAEGTFSDHMVRLRVFQAWQAATEDGNEEEFCSRESVSSSVMNAVLSLRSQCLGHLRAAGFVRPRGPGDIKSLNQYSDNWAMVKGALLAGYYPQLARYGKSGLKTAKEAKVALHPSCTLSRGSPCLKQSTREAMKVLPTEWIMFDRMERSSSHVLLSSVSPISPLSVFLFGGSSRLSGENVILIPSEDGGEEMVLRIDDWTTWVSAEGFLSLGFYLRQKLSGLFNRRLSLSKKSVGPGDDWILRVLSDVLSIEEKSLGLSFPRDVGLKPRSVEAFLRPSEDLKTTHGEEDGASHGFLYSGFPSNSYKFFVVKVSSILVLKAIFIAEAFQFGNQTEKKLLKAFRLGFTSLLFFSVHGSDSFHGFARFKGVPAVHQSTELASLISDSGTQYALQWFRMDSLLFSATSHLTNPYNRSITSSRDGQELEPEVGNAIVKLWGSI